ncbi:MULTISPECIES: hypothetical protein [Pseudoalteromonas]|uniref:Major coat protein n=1 Tax=Pseudoalteromonas marina TaxID=267375 RepID=A0ABT9FAE5_9GAMM|nr:MULTISPECIES: hypothetical protein [Pseudoalteromonas]MBB1331323.1 hypothetical protein [Pseudoalteromonas sp. SR43-7]MDP2563762.1 hypothetical protein [Pseudoalteromonas marina]
MKKFTNILASKRAKAGLLLTSVVASGSSFAADYSAEIGAAVGDGTTNYTAVVAGVITVAAIGFAIGMIVSKLNK